MTLSVAASPRWKIVVLLVDYSFEPGFAQSAEEEVRHSEFASPMGKIRTVERFGLHGPTFIHRREADPKYGRNTFPATRNACFRPSSV